MFIGNCEEVTKCRLASKSGAIYSIALVAGELHKHERGETVKCTHGVRITGENDFHELNFVSKREACAFFAQKVGEKLYNGYRFI